MADYYTILKKTISALPENNGAARRSVYTRARNAIVNQLKAYEPPLSPSEITAEQLRLEEAIRKVEAEAAREVLGLAPVSKPAASEAEQPKTEQPKAEAAPPPKEAAPQPKAEPQATKQNSPASAKPAAPDPAPKPAEQAPAPAHAAKPEPKAEAKPQAPANAPKAAATPAEPKQPTAEPGKPAPAKAAEPQAPRPKPDAQAGEGKPQKPQEAASGKPAAQAVKPGSAPAAAKAGPSAPKHPAEKPAAGPAPKPAAEPQQKAQAEQAKAAAAPKQPADPKQNKQAPAKQDPSPKVEAAAPQKTDAAQKAAAQPAAPQKSGPEKSSAPEPAVSKPAQPQAAAPQSQVQPPKKAPSPLKDTIEAAQKLGTATHKAAESSKQDMAAAAAGAKGERKEPVLTAAKPTPKSDPANSKTGAANESAGTASAEKKAGKIPGVTPGAQRKKQTKPASGSIGQSSGRSIVSLFLIMVVILVGIGILGVVYLQRAVIAALIFGDDQQTVAMAPDTADSVEPAEPAETASVAPSPTPTAPAAPEPAKNADRLLDANGEPAAAPDARTVTTTLITPQDLEAAVEPDTASAAQAPATEDRVPQAPDAQIAALTSPSTIDDPTQALSGATETPALLGSQRSILYEEGEQANGSGTASNGEVVWSLESETDIQGRSQEVLAAAIRIPERDLSVNLRIKPNDDSSLPASHLVEIRYDFPENFSSGDVVNVPGLVMKPTEEARGDALLGASVKVSEGYFWIALSSLASERERNMGLLSDRGWIDIPMLFDTGKRGILTLEKGPTGTELVEQAVAAWQPQ
ncbi:hypothetical protein [Roseibium sp. RKSG952]|uniref:hypothetical protein n=1 Tax=Roseibium sp. RKSG952 TaxID=2529384 RepID=UPI0012BD3571|nr:hypothetical protein [Roseibium sp. RKSG952]